MGEINGILDDVPLVVEIRIYVDCGIGDHQRFGVTRHVEGEDMADPPFGAQAADLVDHGLHDFIRMQLAFHEGGDRTFAHQLNRAAGSRMAVRHIDNLIAVKAAPGLFRGGAYLRFRSDKNGQDQVLLRRFQGAKQGGCIAGMDNRRRNRVKMLGRFDKLLILLSGLMQMRLRQQGAGAFDFLGRSADFRLPLDHRFSGLIDAAAFQQDPRIRFFLADRDPDRDAIANADRLQKMQ